MYADSLRKNADTAQLVPPLLKTEGCGTLTANGKLVGLHGTALIKSWILPSEQLANALFLAAVPEIGRLKIKPKKKDQL